MNEKPWSVRADTAQNRLYMAIKGANFEDRADELEIELFEAVKKLQDGFTIINDMSGVSVLNIALTERLSVFAQRLRDAGSRRTIRIVGTQVMKLQAKRLLATKNLSEVYIVESMEEAETMADQLEASA